MEANFTVLVCSNLSRESVSDMFRSPESQQPYTLSLAVIFMLYLMIGLPWNLLVLGTIIKQRLYLQPTIILLLNLVVTDLLILLFSLTVKTITGLAGEFLLGDSDLVRCEVCRAELVIKNTVDVSAILTIATIAFDRFFFIHKPFYYEKLISVKSSLVTVIVIWLLAVLYSSLNIGLLRDVFFDHLLFECTWDFTRYSYFHIFSILVILLPYAFLLVCDVWVVAIVLRNIRTVYKVQKSSNRQFQKRTSLKMLNEQMRQTRKQKQLHLMRMFGGLIIASTFASLPIAILAIFSFKPLQPHPPPAVYVIMSTASFYSQVVIHPILESTLIMEIRSPILKLLSCAYCYKNEEAHIESGARQGCKVVCVSCCQCKSESLCCMIFKLIGTALMSHVEAHAPSNGIDRHSPSYEHDNPAHIENSGRNSADTASHGHSEHEGSVGEKETIEQPQTVSHECQSNAETF